MLDGIFYFVRAYLWIVLAIVVLFPLILMLVCRLEKQMIHCFEPCDEKDLLKQSAYTKAMNDMAVQHGFINCRWFRHCRGGLYRATATTWFSPDSLILLVVGGGKMAGVNLKKTLLFSKTIGGPVLVTCDESRVSDLSGLIEDQVLWNADLRELYDLHKTRLNCWTERLEPFDSSSPLKEYESIERRRTQILVDEGLARHLDFNQNEWRYTLKGAILLYFRGFRASLKEAKNQKERFSSEKKRPGDA